jgi:hypothetical protein
MDVDLSRKCQMVEAWQCGILMRMLDGTPRECQGKLDGREMASTTVLLSYKLMVTTIWKMETTATMEVTCLLEELVVCIVLDLRARRLERYTPTRIPMLVETL